METSAILTIGLLGIWCSLCLDDKDKSDQRMLGYALGFGLLFILVCKNLYSEDEECSTYEYATNDNDETMGQPQVSDERFSAEDSWIAILGVLIVGFVVLFFVIREGGRDKKPETILTRPEQGSAVAQPPSAFTEPQSVNTDDGRKGFASRVTGEHSGEY